MILTSRAPLRVDFAGAWTDVDLFARGAGGAVVNAAIDKYVHGRLEVHDTIDPANTPKEGIRVTYWCDLPSGSGLGTSAALNVCWLGLIKGNVHPDRSDKEVIAELAYRLEELLGILGGKQDQYAAAIGGFCYMQFGDRVEVEQLSVSPDVVRQLEERLVLCYTGKSRLSGTIHEEVWGAYRRGEPATVRALFELREGAFRMREALLSGNLDEFGRLLSHSWTNQKALAPSVTNDQIEALFRIAGENGAIHGKACGAGGGGCLLFFCEPEARDRVSGALTAAGTRVIPFRFAMEGLVVEKHDG